MAERRTDDLAAALRELLLARAEGTLNDEEFERQQARLHAKLLAQAGEKRSMSRATSASGDSWRRRFASRRHVLLWLLLPLLALAVAGGGYALWRAHHDGVGDATPITAVSAGDGDAGAQIQALLGEVVAKPTNAAAWAELGRAYARARQHVQAADAFAKAAALETPDAQLLADWTDSYVMAHDARWDGTSQEMLRRALAIDPKHPKALALAATEAYDRADYRTAIALWTRMKDAVPPGSPDAQAAQADIQEAEALSRGRGVVTTTAKDAGPAAGAISGRVFVAAAIRQRVSVDDPVFVIARSPDGAGPPLAVKRFTVAGLPAAFTLDDTDSMIPGRTLSNVADAVVIARVSRSGSPAAAKGDFESQPVRAHPGTRGLQLEIAVPR